jgi:hypothetical protein
MGLLHPAMEERRREMLGARRTIGLSQRRLMDRDGQQLTKDINDVILR